MYDQSEGLNRGESTNNGDLGFLKLTNKMICYCCCCTGTLQLGFVSGTSDEMRVVYKNLVRVYRMLMKSQNYTYEHEHHNH